MKNKKMNLMILINLLLVFVSNNTFCQSINYDENQGMFEMTFSDTITMNYIKDNFIDTEIFNNCYLVKWKSGKLHLRLASIVSCSGDNVHILVKYTDGTIADSKKNDDISYQTGNTLDFIHWNIAKEISKIRFVCGDLSYDVSGFSKINRLLADFKALTYKELNDKYNKPIDAYDGF